MGRARAGALRGDGGRRTVPQSYVTAVVIGHALLEFRFYYFTPLYERTVAFYRDVLSFKVYRTWDRGAAERGTIFRSPNGAVFIEVEAGDVPAALSGGLYIEVPDVRRCYEEVRERGAPIVQELGETPYGHLNFKTADPGGLEIAFFKYLSRPPETVTTA